MRNSRKPKVRSGRSGELTASDFEALPDAEKDRIYLEIDANADRLAETAKHLSPRQRKAWAKARNRMGRPKLGRNGTSNISVTVEKDLLRQANAYAKAKGLKRSELVTIGLRLAMARH